MDAPRPIHDGILADSHRDELVVGSGIDEDVIAERGYRTVWGENDPILAAKGFKQNQRLGFGWFAPLHSPLGVEEAIYKPGQPRAPGGKPVKYEYAKGHPAILDAHPRTLPLLGSPDVRLFVTEGVKKGDSLVSCGEAAISLQGIYGWRGRNAAGGATALADWESIATRGRAVSIAFDSDAASNPKVQAAQNRLAGFLAAKGALVQIVHLAPGPGGAKQGVDDFFVAGGTVEGLLSLAEPWEETSSRRRGEPSESSFPEQREFPRTDAGNGELFAHLYGDDVRFDHKRGRWLVWDKHRWREDGTGLVYQLAIRAARSRYRRAENIVDLAERREEALWAFTSESRTRIEAALTLAKTERRIADDGEGWDMCASLIGVRNGVIDLTSGLLRDGRREDKITKQAPVTFDPEARCPTFEHFLNRIQPDAEIRAYLQKRAGYQLTGDISEQDLCFLYGGGANGKTTYVNALMDVMGPDYAIQAAPGLLLQKHNESHPTDIADLDGSRVVVSTEVDDGRALALALMKQLTGSDRLKGRRMRQDFYQFEPTFKLLLLANHKPIIRGTDWGTWRRIKLVPFEETITAAEKDPHLRDKLKAEAPGILNWMIAGCLAWRRDGLGEPPSVTAATEEYRADSDPLRDFLSSECLRGERYTVGATAIFKAYQAWATEQGISERERLTSTAFGRLMGQQFERLKGRTSNSYVGVGLRADRQEPARVEGLRQETESGVESSPEMPVKRLSDIDRVGLPENPPQPSTASTLVTEGGSELSQLASEVLSLSAGRGWDTVRLSAGETVSEGEQNWRRFVEKATPERLERALTALEATA